MKGIKLTTYTAPIKQRFLISQGLYRIMLPNDYIFENKSLTKTLAFLAAMNKFLNFKLHELNNLYGMVFIEYRNNWFYFDKHSRADKVLKDQFNDLQHSFDAVINVYSGANEIHFTFGHMLDITKKMQLILNKLHEVQYSKSNMPDCYRLKVYIDRVKIIELQLCNYPTLV